MCLVRNGFSQGRKKSQPRPQKQDYAWYPLGVLFKISEERSRLFHMGVPSGARTDVSHCSIPSPQISLTLRVLSAEWQPRSRLSINLGFRKVRIIQPGFFFSSRENKRRNDVSIN